MKNLTAPKPSFVNLIVAISIVALAAVFACTSESEEDTPTLSPRWPSVPQNWIAPISR